MTSIKKYIKSKISQHDKQKCLQPNCRGSKLVPLFRKPLDQCPICLEGENVKKIALLDNCEHAFCKDCAAKWFNNKSTCPICRSETRQVIITRGVVFSGDDKETLFEYHDRCRPVKTGSYTYLQVGSPGLLGYLRMLNDDCNYY